MRFLFVLEVITVIVLLGLLVDRVLIPAARNRKLFNESRLEAKLKEEIRLKNQREHEEKLRQEAKSKSQPQRKTNGHTKQGNKL